MSDAAVAQFTEITGASPRVASQYLQITDNDLESAMQLYFENGGAELQISEPEQPSSTRRGGSAGYEDEHGVVHLDSDDDDEGNIPVRTTHEGQSSGSARNTFEDDLEMARRLQEELYAEANPSDTVRAPMARTTETLVGPEADFGFESEILQRMRARRSRQDRPGIFNQRDVSSIWGEEAASSRLSRATGGASDASAKSSMLAEMYRPPFEIMSKLPWDLAREEGRDKKKWLLVNIQDPSVFDCQVLNRDLWKNQGVKDTVKEHFIFLQFSKDDPRAAQYLQYYFHGYDIQDNYPHIAIVDPRTGEQMKVWSGPPVVKAPDFLMQLHEFLDRYSLDPEVRNPVAKRKPEMNPHARIDTMTEEEMMEMALRNSLEGHRPVKHPDPDELTRSIEDIKGKGKAPDTAAEDVDMEDEPSTANGAQEEEEGEEEDEASSAFRSIPSDRPHTEPAADPATTTRIQFRHPNGRVIRRFALSDPVRRLYEWLKASPLEGKAGVEFELVSMGQNLIGLLDTSIQDAGLKNGTVMVGFMED
ncbi:hypothetical protein VTO42DRAFT_6333 [Malbranchea cinnamomea]